MGASLYSHYTHTIKFVFTKKATDKTADKIGLFAFNWCIIEVCMKQLCCLSDIFLRVITNNVLVLFTIKLHIHLYV